MPTSTTSDDQVTMAGGTFHIDPTISLGDMVISTLLVLLILAFVGKWIYDEWVGR